MTVSGQKQEERMELNVVNQEIVVLIDGQEIREAATAYPVDGYELWVSDEYGEGAQRYAEQLQQMVAATPESMSGTLQLACILGSYAPGRKHGAACTESPGLLAVWRVQPNRDRPGLHQIIIDHEIAHLFGDDGGPPQQHLQDWQQARVADAVRGQQLCQAWSNGNTDTVQLKSPNGVTVMLGGQWIDERSKRESAVTGQAEDWATSAAYYLLDRREGQLLHLEGAPVQFNELFPARAAILDSLIK